MILLVDFWRAVIFAHGQVNFKSYFSGKKIYLSQTTGRDQFSRPVKQSLMRNANVTRSGLQLGPQKKTRKRLKSGLKM